MTTFLDSYRKFRVGQTVNGSRSSEARAGIPVSSSEKAHETGHGEARVGYYNVTLVYQFTLTKDIEWVTHEPKSFWGLIAIEKE
jgi:hypothetical protein